ncbi:TolC family protein [Saccharicrinis fermentans]|uniref:Type I secretion outer membrane protein n=1 Tax=Saccharicrinis fermentans DSM 9555 = JCM 21142 TaxID=869213 RepID=W7YHQ1_9BACT|nr:TolC family protein [Saccharicrinis fermentans]GAF02069.1 type I secretion outer membrane protein [Saccharicrinis fermentans DSM 9555 = JCM 21142]
MIKIILPLFVVLLFSSLTHVNAQKVWTLEECISYAFENNITVKRQALNAAYQQNELQQSKMNRLPDLNAQTSYGHSYGYTWVQQEAENIDVNNRSFGMGIGTSVDVFNGFSARNTVRRNKIDLMASLASNEVVKNDIALRITSQYLQILFDKELLAVAKEQYEVTNQQVERALKLVAAGSEARGSYLEIKSQAAKEALTVTQQENNLALSILDLAQLLDLENVDGFDVVSPVMPR